MWIRIVEINYVVIWVWREDECCWVSMEGWKDLIWIWERGCMDWSEWKKKWNCSYVGEIWGMENYIERSWCYG